ncbi:MAG: hypothetical protein ACI80V_002409 [Rhodothermales bacterium]
MPWSLHFTRAFDATGTAWGAAPEVPVAGGPDIKIIDLDGDDVVLLDGDGNELLRDPAASLTPPLIVTGGSGNSTLTVTAAMATAGLDIRFEGTTGFNTLII